MRRTNIGPSPHVSPTFRILTCLTSLAHNKIKTLGRVTDFLYDWLVSLNRGSSENYLYQWHRPIQSSFMIIFLTQSLKLNEQSAHHGSCNHIKYGISIFILPKSCDMIIKQQGGARVWKILNHSSLLKQSSLLHLGFWKL